MTYGLVIFGVLTHYGADCQRDGVCGPGAPLTDPAGDDHPHLGRNETGHPVVLQVTNLTYAGAPPSDDAANPGCDRA